MSIQFPPAIRTAVVPGYSTDPTGELTLADIEALCRRARLAGLTDGAIFEGAVGEVSFSGEIPTPVIAAIPAPRHDDATGLLDSLDS